MIPLLLKPRLLAARNIWLRGKCGDQRRLRDAIIVALAIIVMLTMYAAVYTVLSEFRNRSDLVFIPIVGMLNLGFTALLALLVLSSIAAALGTLYLARDLELILTAPISFGRLFFGKYLEVVLASSWVVMIFGFPLLVALAQVYQMPHTFYLFAILTLTPLFVLPAGVAMLVVTLLARFVPLAAARRFLAAISLLTILGFYISARQMTFEPSRDGGVSEVLRILSFLSVLQTGWSPSSWAATSLGQMLENRSFLISPHLILLYSVSALVVPLTYLTLRQLHGDAYSAAQSQNGVFRIRSKESHRRSGSLFRFLRPQSRALMGKEIKTFTRDITHTVQMILLIAVCILYLYNFKVLHLISSLPESIQHWWDAVLTLANCGLGALIITAISARFVFPSISLEGQSFWILNVAPLSLNDILQAKVWCWFFPLALIASVIFVTGAFALDVEPQLIVMHAILSWSMCYGIVGVAIGSGAYFARFDWDHPAQITASLGSLVFMILAIVLVAINLLPTGLLISLKVLHTLGIPFLAHEWPLAIGATAILICYINIVATRIALTTGSSVLNIKTSL